MNREEKKQIIKEYLNTRADMGIIYFHCSSTNMYFLEASKNTRAGVNRVLAQLRFNTHSNKELQKIWNEYGESKFDYGILEELKYDEKQPDKTDYTKELDELLQRKLKEYTCAKAIR